MHRERLHHICLFLFACTWIAFPLHAQKKTILGPGQLNPVTTTSPGRLATPRPAQPGATARTTAVSPIVMGQSANFFSSSIPMNNCVHADDSSDQLLFIHRQDPAIWGGSNQSLRYDISTDGGATIANDVGPLNPVALNGRYPQVAGYRPAGSTNPLVGSAVYTAEAYNGVNWAGLATGTASLQTISSPSTQEAGLTAPTQIPAGGMTQGLRGEYWAARIDESGNGLTDSLRIFKGVYNPGTQATAWVQHLVRAMPWDLSYNGTRYALTPTVAFSPDGSIGWIATLGDISGVMDSVYAPILLKSTDAGATWGAPQEIDLNSFAWVKDSLEALWLDTLGGTASGGRATAAYEHDLTVDAAGNPHMFFVIGSASTVYSPPGYTFFSALSKYAVDLSSTNQGSSYTLRLVSPILTFRGGFGSANPVFQDNYPQVSRRHDGQYIFYSWLDSDTAQYTGNQTGVGFGVSDNVAPNLRIAGLRIADGYSTCIHMVTDGDLIWEGRALSMQLAPESFTSGSGASSVYRLPIVGIEMLNNDPNQSCRYAYFGNDAVLTENDFAYPPGSSVYWFGCGVPAALAAYIQGKVFVDDNANGIFDGTDVAIDNHVVSTTPLSYADVTDAAGDFDIASLINNTYGLVTQPLNPSLWSATTPTVPYSLSPTTAGSILPGNNFGFTPVVLAEDLSVALVPDPIRPGFPTTATLYIENLGSLPTAGTLVLRYDSLATITAATPAYASNNTTTHEVTWTLPTIPLFGSYAITVNGYLPPSVPINTNLLFTAEVTPTGVDIVPANNGDTVSVTVIGAYDPNDKAVLPAGDGANHRVDPGTTLKYRIRFQNTGTASAINVVVRDTLDADLELLSLHMLGASHAYNLSIEQGNILVWSFNGINLPDSNSNEPASHGHIDFSIAPQPGLPLGTVVDNSASIYFDFNAPILTNTAWITYDVPSATEAPVATPAIRIYPNPASSSATIEFQRHDGESWDFELLDLQGRRVRKADGLTEARYTLARGDLPAGIYLYRVTTQDRRVKSGKLVLE